MAILLAPITAFTSSTEWAGHKFTEEEIERIQNSIPINAIDIYHYWLNKRRDNPDTMIPIRRSDNKIGRNDPCPCGSGKKFKKCCLH